MRIIPERLRGRIFALLRTMMQSGGPIGGAAGGLVLPWLGIPAMIVVATLVVGLPGLLGARVGELRRDEVGERRSGGVMPVGGFPHPRRTRDTGSIVQRRDGRSLGVVERLFGRRGACGGCWCMYWRLPRPAFEQGKGEGNRTAFRAIVASGEVPGILGYDEGVPVAWCAVGPRETYPVLARSRMLKPVDEEPVWSIVCFFVARAYRRRGITVPLLEAAVASAAARGARIVEGYPIEPRQPALPDAFVSTGLASAFVRAGFVEVARRSETRPIMRRFVDDGG
jgi:GNAT superfamily N-acetyltransferase